MKEEYRLAYFELKKILENPLSTEEESDFAQEAMDRYYNTFDGWKSAGSCIQKGEKAIKDGNRAIFHSSQLKPNDGQLEYCMRDELLGTNHFGI
jgi:hypothetical protein